MPNDDMENWHSVGIGIVTFATILAAATAAGIFAVAARQEGYSDWARGLAAFAVTISLLAYAAVVVNGIATLFRESQTERKGVALNAAKAVYVQSYSAVFAAVLMIYFPLLERIPG